MRMIDFILDRTGNCSFCGYSEYSGQFVCVNEQLKSFPEFVGRFVGDPCKLEDYKICPMNKDEKK
jgi:hypothetical protein